MSVAKYFVHEMGEAIDLVLDRPQRVHSFNPEHTYEWPDGPSVVKFNPSCCTLFPSLIQRIEKCDCDATICPDCWECGLRGEWKHHPTCDNPSEWPEIKE